MPTLFDPLRLRNVEFRNRVWMSPMCMYSAAPTGPAIGQATDFHLAHLGARAAGGVGLVMVEATAVTPEGRITPNDLGLWHDAQIEPLRRIVRLVEQHGAVPGIQLAHAGRKASTARPWEGKGPVAPEDGGWMPVGPSPIANPGLVVPRELHKDELSDIVEMFYRAAIRALDAGFKVVEIHGAHGYLIHSFLSPASNHRTDEYGGVEGNRTRFPLEVVDAVRNVWPAQLPVFYRTSATDWLDATGEEGWTGEATNRLAVELKDHGVDLLDVSSGGLIRNARIPIEPGYQVPFAASAKAAGRIPTAAVGLINDPQHANSILEEGSADAIMLARALLRDPYWVHHAAIALGGRPAWPVQYSYAVDRAPKQAAVLTTARS